MSNRPDGAAVCHALGLRTRSEILRELMRCYPQRLSISEIKRRLNIALSHVTVHFHLRELSRCGLVELDGSGRGFRAQRGSLVIRFDKNGFRVGE